MKEWVALGSLILHVIDSDDFFLFFFARTTTHRAEVERDTDGRTWGVSGPGVFKEDVVGAEDIWGIR